MIFSYNSNIDKNAYMNWRTNSNNTEFNFWIIGKGYFEASIILTKECIENNLDKKADIVIYPILFNAIHGIELYLKSLYIRLAELLEKPQKFAGGHNIKSLLGMVSALVKEIKQNKIEFKKYELLIKDLDEFINEIYEKTDKMDFARYPMDNNKENYFYVDNLNNEVINLPILLDKIINIHEILENLQYHFTYDY